MSKKSIKKVFSPLGASSHSLTEREKHDYYATEPKALEMLLELETFSDKVWECACGGGHLADVLKAHGHDVKASDIIDRGYEGADVLDFLSLTKEEAKEFGRRDIITNPPYKYAQAFTEHALEISEDGTKIAMFLRLQFLEGQARRRLFLTNPPKTIYVSSSRLKCGKNGEFNQAEGSAIAFAWFIWEKGFKGEPTIKWFN
jgi:hypothetical protein